MITAEGDGVIEYVDATTIRILYDRTEDEEFVSFEPALKEYRIPKFRRTNQNMTIDLRPICNKGQRVSRRHTYRGICYRERGTGTWPQPSCCLYALERIQL